MKQEAPHIEASLSAPADDEAFYLSRPSLFRRLLCDHGFHDLKTAQAVGFGDIEITGKKNHPALRLLGDYEIFRCACSEYFTTGIQTHKQAPA